MGEIFPGVPLKGAKTLCFFSVFSAAAIFEIKMWIGFHMRTLVKISEFLHRRFSACPEQLKWVLSRVGSLCARCSSNGTILGDGNHFCIRLDFMY